MEEIMMKCPACGFKNLPGAAICENCTTDLTFFEAPRPVTESKIERAIMQDKLDQICTEKSIAITVQPDMMIREVIDLMIKNQKCSVVIMEGEIIKGIFTERSLLKRVCGESPINVERPIAEAMLKDPEILKSSDCVAEALHMMEVGGYTYAIVEGNPLRVLNIKDILEYIIELEV
jgi:signal-transduction protein with cAMP-binding, CBS, and nucleotidyltransferase domain